MFISMQKILLQFGFWMTPPNQTYTLSLENMIFIADLYNNFLTNYSNENNLAICDATSKLEASYRNYYDDTHFNTNGAANMKNALVDCILNIYK